MILYLNQDFINGLQINDGHLYFFLCRWIAIKPYKLVSIDTRISLSELIGAISPFKVVSLRTQTHELLKEFDEERLCEFNIIRLRRGHRSGDELLNDLLVELSTQEERSLVFYYHDPYAFTYISCDRILISTIHNIPFIYMYYTYSQSYIYSTHSLTYTHKNYILCIWVAVCYV